MLSARPETWPTTGSSRPAGGAAAEEGAGAGVVGAAPVSLSVTEDTELVTPPSRDVVSESASAEAAGDEKVNQVRVAAPARSTGRSARHGETALAMRTTPSTVAFDDAYSLR